MKKNEKKNYLSFRILKNMANFEAFCRGKYLSKNLLFLCVKTVVATYLVFFLLISYIVIISVILFICFEIKYYQSHCIGFGGIAITSFTRRIVVQIFDFWEVNRVR